MKSIKLTKRPRLKDPILVAAWPGMGDVALRAAHYLKDKLGALEFARMPASDFFQPSGIAIDNGIAGIPPQPTGKFYFHKGGKKSRDIVIFISEAQPFIEKSYGYANEIIDFALTLGVKEVYTFAAMPLPVEHTQAPQVYIVATNGDSLKKMSDSDFKIMRSGQISGLNGLVLGVARERGLKGVCILGEIPLYTIQIENPIASMAVLSVISKLIGITIDLTGLKERAKHINQEIEQLIDYLKNPAEETESIEQIDIDMFKKDLAQAPGLPDSAKQLIDRLFKESKKDLSRALELKNELDKWNVYEQYEDSFLDLFKKPTKKDN